jgi:hypothetical protein
VDSFDNRVVGINGGPATAFGASPEITWATADYTNQLCYVDGSNFGTKQGAVTVGAAKLTVKSWTPTEIVAALPSGVVPGSYLISVTTTGKGGQKITANFDAAFGTEGAQGATGPTGAIGATGPTGTTGSTVPGNDNIITDADYNTAIGIDAFNTTGTGEYNTAGGYKALYSNTSGTVNTAGGYWALESNTTGSYNTALGNGAGYWSPIFSGSYNIYIGYNVSPAAYNESNTIRIGVEGTQSATYIAGISTITGDAVYVDSSGRLGTLSSSRRHKEDIEDMGDASSGLMKLRPVSFHYKPEYAEGPRRLQYGLIAEEVAEVYPDLVLYDPKTGQPQTVYYHLVNAMLLNEVQKQQKELSALKEQVRELSALVEQNKGSSGRLSKLETQRDR